MGLPLACLVALCLALASARNTELRREGRTRNHGHNVCSTWGDFHYKTFDGDIFRFPGLCDYNLASDCRDAYKEFAVHLKRSPGHGGDHPQLEYILLTIKDDTIYLTRQLVVVNGAMVSTPHYSSGLLIEKNDAYTKVFSRAGLALMWNREDSLMLELDGKFRNHTCGLCGDYNGLQTYSEFLTDGVLFSAIEFGNMQKISKPEVVCDDPEDVPAPKSCSEHRAECERLLTATAFEECLDLVPLEPYVQACMQDHCQCPPGAACVCSTVAEFSRQCSHAGGHPGNWRTPTLCPKSCPGNMVYLESGSPCMDTCSHLEVSSLCEEHRMDGCFCPEGTVYDDIAGSGCIPVSQCHCKLHGHLYAPGRQVTNNCEQCVCNAGRWVCKDLPCPGTCALEGGSHITTFDGKKYTFHGDCYYVLAKGDHNDSYALLGELAPCGSTDKQTCLKTVVLLADKKKNVVAFKSDGSVLLNELQVNLPHVTASFSIFQPSSYHLVVNTAFGLRLQVQLAPVMQLFLTLDQAAQGHVQGLCGNFNGQEGDDFKTAGGLVEATGAGFANTWKAQSSCQDKLDWLDDPCSLNIESANYAEHWCSLLKKTETPFGRCHAAVDPAEYYKRCKYDTCNCQNNEDCMCAALSSYVRACATKGVMLWGWRELVCNKDVGSCPKSQIFLYNLTSCHRTCRSLSEADSHCLKGFAPVDGCGCPDHTFLDEKGRCVPLAKCSCYHRGLYLEAGEVVLRQEERCVCRNGRLHCMQVKLLGQSCAAPKIHIDCNNLTALAIRNPRPVSCQTLDAGYYQTECISGCMCPGGLIDDGRGGCVVEEECPCVHNKDLYAPGDKIKVDCNTCTCRRGHWACTQTVCHGTCTIYGSGHYITFDGKYYDFDGHCSYVAAQDYCGQNSSLGSFSIITENVPCGTTGVTCSKAIKIFMGRTELKLEDKHRVVIQRDVGHHVAYTTREVGQYLVVETSTGIIVIWDKKTTIFIKLAPSYKGTVCGLCGNFDQRSNNDFTTRDHMVVESELDFGNSWKEAPTCPDVTTTPEPCTKNPHRRAWAEKQCSIIKSPVFGVCHSKVDPKPFYEACVHDSCSCDTGGDCECFCSAVASYAQECTKEGACVFWRTPDLCPIFCDYYNPPDECEWHYEPCGNRSFETCRTINGIHSNISVSYLEGCYPHCPEDRPIYDEDLKKCVTKDECGCYVEDTHYPPGASVPTENVCQSCVCTNSSQVVCQPEEGKILNFTQDGAFCYWEICGPNGTVEKHFNICTSTPPPATTTPVPSTPTPTTTATTTTPTPSTVSPSSSTTPKLCCFWSDWINEDHPGVGSDGGDQETFDSVCQAPEDIQCRSATEPHLSWEDLGQKAQCNVSFGFICKNKDQFGNGPFEICYDYEIRVNCCLPMDECPESPTSSPTTPITSPTTTSERTTMVATTTTPPTATPETTTTVTTTKPTTTLCVDDCKWTGWLDSGKPNFTKPGGDIESIENVCQPGWAANISCRASKFPNIPIGELGQTVVCDLSVGLVCKNQDQRPGGVMPQPFCLNYEINVYCCRQCASTPVPSTTTKETPTPTPIITTTTTETPTPTPTITSTETPTPTPIITSTETPTPTPIITTTTTESPTPTPTITSTKTPTPTPIITTTTEKPTPTPIITTTTTIETPTPIITSRETPTLPPIITTTNTETPTPIIISTETPTPTPIITTTTTETPTPPPIITTTTTETPTPTPIITTPETPTPTPIITSTETPTPTPIITTTTTETPTPTPIITTTNTIETSTPTPIITSTETPTPTPIMTTTTTKTPTPPSIITTTTTEIPTPTPIIISTETPTPTPIITTTTTETPTPTPIITTTTETPTPTPIITSTETPTPTPIMTTTTTKTPTPPPIITTTTTETPTPTPIIISTETPTPTPIITTTTTETPTPTPIITTTTETPTPTPIITSTETPTPTPIMTTTTTKTPTPPSIITTTTTETPTPTPIIISTETPTPTPIITTTTTETPTPTPIITSTETPTPTPIITTTTTETPTMTPIITTTIETPTPTPTTSPTPTSERTTMVTTTTTPPTATPETTTTVTTTKPTTTLCVDDCKWTGWLDSGKPNFTKPGGDIESIENVCQPGWAANISCRASKFPNIPIGELGQTVVCDLSVGLVCKNQDQRPGGVMPQPFCLNYEINVYCCRQCASTPVPPTTTKETPTPTPTITSAKTPTPTPIITTTTTIETPTPTPIITSAKTPTLTPIITTTTTETPTPTTTVTLSTTPTITSTETPTPTPIITTTTTETPTPTPTITSTETPTPTPIIPTTTTETPTPTPIITSTETPTPTPIITTTTTEIPTPTTTVTLTTTPTITSTETPTPTPIITTTTNETPTPTPIITSTETPTPTPIINTTTTTETPTPTLIITTTRETPISTPITTTTAETPTTTVTLITTPIITSTETPTPTPIISTTTTETPTSTPIVTTTTTETSTPTPIITTTTETPTPTPIITSTETPTPTPIITTTRETPTSTPITTTSTETPTPTTEVTLTTTPIITSTETPTPTPIISTTTTETATPKPTTISTETPTPTPIITTTTTETPTPTPTIISSETPTPIITTTTEAPTPTPTTSVTPTPRPTTTSTETPVPTSTIPTHETTTRKPSHSTTPSSMESTTLLTTPPTIVQTSSPPTGTKPTVPTTGGTTPSPPPIPGTTTPGLQTSGPTSSKTTPTGGTTTGPTSPTTEAPSTPTPTPVTVSTTTTGTPTPTGRPSTTPSTLTTSQATSTSTRVPTPTMTPIVTPSTSMNTGSQLSTSPIIVCCVLNDTYYAPGEMVYNGTHGDTCYYVNCSLNCSFEIFNWPCPSTPSPTPTSSKPTPSSTSSPSTPTTRPSTTSSTPATTKPPGCPDFDPPRQENETWWLCNCTKAVCKHDNTVELVEVECKPPPMPTCSNNLTPVRVLDPDGCCWHWECDCYCTGWGDPHYVTFDGLYYSYQGNCTYVLVEEITSTVDNFGVYIDNYHCDVTDQVSCPRTLIVRHETQEVLIKTVQMAPMKVQVQVNKQAVALPYKKYGLQVYESGINYVVDIPELGALISYNGLSFSIRLPYRLFGNNTKGQCGTCTNNTEDDCVLPSGEVISDCEVAADQWVVNDPSKPHCPHTSFTTRRPATTPLGGSGNTPNKDCASPLCELIKDSLFAQCHTLAPPQHYYDACVFDSCFVPNSGMECASLQTYAALCAQEGICIDWRNHTHGACPVTCPPHREYRACGPAEEPTCKASSSQNNTLLVEGCFCPEGTMNYAPGFDVCVELCGCVGPDNVPREFGEHFEFDCKDCVCLEGGSGIVCQPKKCSQKPPSKCTEDGTYLVTEVDPADTCCNVTSCKCNVSLCKEKPPMCPLGFDVKSEMIPGRCCPFYSCVPKGVCVLENAEYQPGSPVYSSKCQQCVCTNTTDSATQLNVVSCSHVPCNTSCSLGFELVDAPGECCRKCEQTHCIISRPGSQLVLKPGDIKSDPKNNCTFFSCVKIHNQLISSVSNITCPDFDPSTCLPGSITLMPNGCCKKCIPRNETRIPCSTIPVTRKISDAGCTGTVTMNYCSGSCGTFAMYSAEAQALDHKCSCCKEERTSQRQVVLSCPGGSSRSHTYTHIESCLCQDTTCELLPAQRRAPGRARRSDPQALSAGRG